jgi:small-conductance mechanosensitive channel
MIEEFDAIQRLNLTQFLVTAVGFLLLGLAMEAVLRLGRRWALSHGQPWVASILNALTWQPIFWALLLGTVSPLLMTIREVTGWQRNTGAIQVFSSVAFIVIAVRLINSLLKMLTMRRPSASVSLLNNLITGLGVVTATAITFGYIFNVPVSVLLLTVVGGITGLTVIFQEPLRNLVSGVSLTLSSRLGPGDWVRLPSGLEGAVTDIQWDVTMVRQLANNSVVVSNSAMTEAEIINYNRPDPVLAILLPVGVSYSSDLQHVEAVTLEEAMTAMLEVNGDDAIGEPVIRYQSFAESSINFNVVLRAKRYDDQFLLRHVFIKRLHRRYNEEGIVIPFPIRTLHSSPGKPLAVAYRPDSTILDQSTVLSKQRES